MKIYLISILLIVLSACTTNKIPENSLISTKPIKLNTSINPIQYNEEIWNTEINSGRFIHLSSELFREYQKDNKQFKIGLFDIQGIDGHRDFEDSNYHIRKDMFTTTYRPNTYYGNNIKTYTPYCPVFYDSKKQEEIENTINKMININQVSVEQISEYLVLSSFSSCALLNKNYQEKRKEITEINNLILADKFALFIFTLKGDNNMIDLIINQNKKLTKYKEKISDYVTKVKINKKSLYELWKISYSLN